MDVVDFENRGWVFARRDELDGSLQYHPKVKTKVSEHQERK
jgi:hypothetical protein